MRWPRLRFSMWWVVIAVAAIGCGAEVMRRRRAVYLKLASENARWETLYRRFEGKWRAWSREDKENAGNHRRAMAEIARSDALQDNKLDVEHSEIKLELERALAEIDEKAASRQEAYAMVQNKRAAYHEQLRRKYVRAARQPWRGVAQDPPEPDWDAMRPPRGIPPVPTADTPLDPQ